MTHLDTSENWPHPKLVPYSQYPLAKKEFFVTLCLSGNHFLQAQIDHLQASGPDTNIRAQGPILVWP